MPIAFACPHCAAQLNVPGHFAGQPGTCPKCQGRLIIPVTSLPAVYAPSQQRSVVTLVVVMVVVLGLLFVVGAAFIGIMTAWTIPAARSSQQAAMRAPCNSNLQRIGVAMQAYHAKHGSFPPAYVPDENGRPVHSWRVLILPYLGEQALYDQYDFDEPWDGPNNMLLADRMPAVYGCPASFTGFSSRTTYMMVVGPGTISDGPGTTRLDDVADGPSETILVVEGNASGVKWLEPKDVLVEETDFGVNSSEEGVFSDHFGGAHVLFCDGSVRFLSDMTDPDVLRGMTTIDGGETADSPIGEYEE